MDKTNNKKAILRWLYNFIIHINLTVLLQPVGSGDGRGRGGRADLVVRGYG